MTARWISLCAGLDAVACRAMTGDFPPVTRMGGKRSVADHVLQILGVWPTRWLMIDADPAIVEFWQAAFGGWLPAVAEIIRAAPCDGEELWKLWKDEPVPFHPLERVAHWQVLQAGNFGSEPVVQKCVGRSTLGWKASATMMARQRVLAKDLLAARNERLARWIVLQKGNFSGKPLSYGEKGEGLEAYKWNDATALAEWGGPAKNDNAADRVDVFWKGVAGYASVSERGIALGWKDRINTDATSESLDDFAAGPGYAMYLDLATSSPVFRERDLVTIDPPYKGTTGYGTELTRERVVELALEAHERGCRVLVHEAEPVITGGPWRAVELERRVGRNQRTWSKQRREIATINFEPSRMVSHTMAPMRTCGGFEGPLFPTAFRP